MPIVAFIPGAAPCPRKPGLPIANAPPAPYGAAAMRVS